MIDSNELRKGVTFEIDGNLYKVLDYWHNKTARGKATIRIKARDIRSGATIDKTFNSGERVQDILVNGSPLFNGRRAVRHARHDGVRRPVFHRRLQVRVE